MSILSDRRIHLDSSVYIAALKGETIPAHGGMSRVELAELVLGAGEARLIAISTLTVTLVEVRRGADSSAISDKARIQAIDSLFDQSLTSFIDVDRELALAARRIANEYGIGTMDAIQIASAEAARCDELFMWDNRVVSKFSANPMPGLSICEPYWEGQMDSHYDV